MKIPRLAVLIMLVLFTGHGGAEFCKWEDENGVVHYAETCVIPPCPPGPMGTVDRVSSAGGDLCTWIPSTRRPKPPASNITFSNIAGGVGGPANQHG